MISVKKLLYKMVETIKENRLPEATTADAGKVLGIKSNGSYGLIAQTGGDVGDVKVLNFTISNISANGEKTYTFTDAMLAERGIDNVLDYEVIGISVREAGRSIRYYNMFYAYTAQDVYPKVVYVGAGEAGFSQGFQITVRNTYSSVRSVDVRMVLAKMA